MKISSAVGEFKILQTVKNRDELLVLGSWNDLVRLFDSSRTFLVNRTENLFGLYLCKQECADFLTKILQQIDNQDSEDFRIEKSLTEKRYLA
ncbi:hypothetical protein SAMN04488519_104235 [Algoriphagus ornithinivorans]|uniref:Uncharacterized protein n=1 Tax=Algoriphagus ornithinivorans TaxID=226506 RepID=A0A1I5F638_9BACT|nr:hypothetical protein [Algoriphagus ornithinivorans]SFO19268.1 hypothetical protein SAMN04488519_104235 [Algoriphagus ornithinivorans]